MNILQQRESQIELQDSVHVNCCSISLYTTLYIAPQRFQVPLPLVAAVALDSLIPIHHHREEGFALFVRQLESHTQEVHWLAHAVLSRARVTMSKTEKYISLDCGISKHLLLPT